MGYEVASLGYEVASLGYERGGYEVIKFVSEAFKARPEGAKIVQVSAEPSLLELCRTQPILCNEHIAQGIALGRARR